MSDNANFVQGHDYTLSGSGISASATSITLNDFTDIYGDSLAMSDFGTIGYLVLEPATSKAENISFTGVTNNGDGTWTVTGVTRGLAAKAPYTAGGFGDTHSGGAIAIISNSVQFYDKLTSKDNDETINGIYTFTQSPVVPGGATGSQSINADQLAATAFSGASDASTTVTGITRESISSDTTIGVVTVTIASPAVFAATSNGLTVNDSVRFTTTGALPTGLAVGTVYFVISAGLTANNFEVSTTRGGSAVNTTGSQSGTHTLIRTTPIAVGTLDPRVPTQSENDALAATTSASASNLFVTQKDFQKGVEIGGTTTGSTNAYVFTPTPAITAYAAPMVFNLKANFTNSGAATINISGLGAIAIKKADGTVALASGDIVSGQTFTIQYDGTNFQLKSPTANTPTGVPTYKTGTTSKNAADASTTQTIAHGLGVIPKFIRIKFVIAIASTPGGSWTAESAYNGTTQASISVYANGNFSDTQDNTLTLNASLTTGTQVGAITYDATNISIVWVKTGSPTGTYSGIWEAIA